MGMSVLNTRYRYSRIKRIVLFKQFTQLRMVYDRRNCVPLIKAMNIILNVLGENYSDIYFSGGFSDAGSSFEVAGLMSLLRQS